MNVGRAWAIVRGRMNGNVEDAQGLLSSMRPAKLKEMNRQNAAARGTRRRRLRPYKLGEPIVRRK